MREIRPWLPVLLCLSLCDSMSARAANPLAAVGDLPCPKVVRRLAARITQGIPFIRETQVSETEVSSALPDAEIGAKAKLVGYYRESGAIALAKLLALAPADRGSELTRASRDLLFHMSIDCLEEVPSPFATDQVIAEQQAFQRDILSAFFDKCDDSARIEYARQLASKKQGMRNGEGRLFPQLLRVPYQETQQAIEAMGGRELYGQHASGPFVAESEISAVHALDSLAAIQPGQTMVDIGSGLGTPAFYFGLKHPGLKVQGFEIVPIKAEMANQTAARIGLSNVKFAQQDLGDPAFHLPPADYYYMFNPVHRQIRDKLMAEIREIAKTRKVRILIKGNVPADMQVPWLKGVGGVPGNGAFVGSVHVLESIP